MSHLQDRHVTDASSCLQFGDAGKQLQALCQLRLRAIAIRHGLFVELKGCLNKGRGGRLVESTSGGVHAVFMRRGRVSL